MRQTIEVSGVHPGVPPDEAFAALEDLEQHVVRTSVVRSVRVEPGAGPDEQVSHWEVQYRNGVLRWSQHDAYDRPARTLRFTRRDGDPAELDGAWRVEPADGGGSRITFSCDFDLGIPSLGAFIDPLAGRILRETVAQQLQEAFGPGLQLQEA